MSGKTKKLLLVLVWGIAILVLLFNTLTVYFLGFFSWDSILPGFLLMFSLGVVGSLIVNRQPYNPVGWTFFVVFCYLILEVVLETSLLLYLDQFPEVTISSIKTLGFIHAYSSEVLSLVGWSSLLIFPILYFPNGELPSPRWRYLLWLVVALLVLWMVGGAFSPELSSELFQDFQNPLSIPLAGQILKITEPVLVVALVVPPLSLIFRYRKSQGVERQQIKWPLYSAMLSAIGIGFEIFVSVVFSAGEGDLLFNIGVTLEALSVLTFPITIGIAILRYRLYDIDLIINRTLVYGALTGTLALVYYGSVVLLQRIFATDSPIVIVISTLAIAALFSPLRRRIQEGIDRRFYRRKYDAQKTLADFNAVVRDEVELGKISDSLLGAVEETLHPEHASLWLRRPD